MRIHLAQGCIISHDCCKCIETSRRVNPVQPNLMTKSYLPSGQALLGEQADLRHPFSLNWFAFVCYIASTVVHLYGVVLFVNDARPQSKLPIRIDSS